MKIVNVKNLRKMIIKNLYRNSNYFIGYEYLIIIS